MAVFGQSGCIWAKVVIIGLGGCNRAKWLYLGKIGFIWANQLYYGKSGCIRANWLYFGKIVVFGQI